MKEDIYIEFGSLLLDLLPETGWERAILELTYQPKSIGMSACYISSENGDSISLKSRFNSELKGLINAFHRKSTENPINKWNKLTFILFPTKKFELEFTWDEEYQKHVDFYNEEAEKNDSSYERPKWHWET